MEMNETKIGRLVHKIEKLKTLGEKNTGVEFMRSEVVQRTITAWP